MNDEDTKKLYDYMTSGSNNFDFSKKYNGISEDSIKSTIDSIISPTSGVNQIILATTDIKPIALVFTRIETCRWLEDLHTPDNYYFTEHK
jgi:hypothetical protein